MPFQTRADLRIAGRRGRRFNLHNNIHGWKCGAVAGEAGPYLAFDAVAGHRSGHGGAGHTHAQPRNEPVRVGIHLKTRIGGA